MAGDVEVARGSEGGGALDEGRRSLTATAEALSSLAEQLDRGFEEIVDLLLHCRGHVVVSGAGTSSTIAQRLAHLLTVVGVPAFYLSSGDSTHGGAATVTDDDLLVAISKGGESDELNGLVQVARDRGVPVVAITQNPGGGLAALATHPLLFSVPDEIDAEGVIALGSSLAAGAVGDALCFAVFAERGFDAAHFHRIHPGGAVGKALSARTT